MSPPPSRQTHVEFSLVVRGLRKSFQAGIRGCHARANVLNGIDVDVRAGEIVGICGAVGSGKTTLLLCMAGLLRPDTGTVTVRGMHGVSPDRLAAYVALRAPESGAATPSQHLARALAAGSPVLLLDGFLADLSTGTRTLLGQLASRGMTIVAAERHRSQLEPLVERIIELRDGYIRSSPPGPRPAFARTAAARVAEPNAKAMAQ